MKKIILSLMTLFTATAAMAQLADDDKQIFNHLGGGISVGTDGIGINLATTISPYVQMRAGVNFVPKFKLTSFTIDAPASELSTVQNDLNKLAGSSALQPYIDEDLMYRLLDADFNEDIDAEIKLNLFDVKLLFDIYPTKTSPWHLTVGFYAGKSKFVEACNTNYQNQLQLMTDYNAFYDSDNGKQAQQAYAALHGGTLPRLEAQLGNETVEPDGPEAHAYIKVNGFKPYIGIGSGRAISQKHRLSFSWDLGAQFWGTPKFYLQGKKLDETGDDDVDDVIDIVNDIKVYPTLSIRLNGRFL